MISVTKRLILLRFSFISFFLLLSNPAVLYSQEQYICVWRNPERTMTRIFPNAADYRTVNSRISREKRSEIENLLGSELLSGQQDQFQHFEMLDSTGLVIGYTIPSTQKGRFGAIEFVFGIDNDHRIKGIYIQRARERDKQFRSREFLDSFTGSELIDIDESNHENLTDAMGSVILGIRKELITFGTLRDE